MTDRQRRFLDASLRDQPWPNATRAAREAGYAWPRQQGPRLTTFPAINADAEQRRRERALARLRVWRLTGFGSM
jgi:phage terminase small subunit